jgi:hypothetical protein
MNKLKIRKEKFGWLVCNIKTCEVYEVSEEVAKILLFIEHLNDEDTVNLAEKISTHFNMNIDSAKSKLEQVYSILKINHDKL